jgi:protein-S-isoprenylcysteine O-methyltransferase Ste14
MNAAFLTIFTVFWSGLVLTFDGFIVHELFKQAESVHYQFVTGAVTHSEVRIHHSSKGGTSYEPVIHYRYEVGGQAFTGARLRYNSVSSSSHVTASSMVDEHPADSTIQVFYDQENPQDSLLFPGIEGSDFMLILFLTPFNMVMIGLLIWFGGWLWERIFRPAAGGMKIITDGMYTRVRLPQYGAVIWWLGATGGLGFAAIFVIGLSTQMRPSIAVILTTIAVVYLAGVGVFLWQWMKIRSGIDDLVINEGTRSLDLPETFGRTERVTVNIADIESLAVEQIEHRNNKGGISYTYAPTLRLRRNGSAGSKLADWSDKLKADDFAEWLRKKLGL